MTASEVQTLLDMHNTVRANYQAPPLTWDATIASRAQAHANTCVYGHSSVDERKTYGFGENIAAGGNRVNVGSIWNNEECAAYKQPDPNQKYNVAGHFTQNIWKNSRKIGCGLATRNDCPYGNYLVCQYNPPGNVTGQYTANLLNPKVAPRC